MLSTSHQHGQNTQVFHDVACTACGCVCDDLTVEIRDRQVIGHAGACSLSQSWLGSLNCPVPVPVTLRGQAATVDAAVAAAAQLLNSSSAPLVYGLSRSCTAGQKAAVAIADRIGAAIDTTASVCHGPSIMAIQAVGECTCTLGEVRDRADLVLFWGADPVTSHPRHLERYSADPHSEFLPLGRADRTLVVLDVQQTPTSLVADRFIPVDPGRDFELIWTLRQLLRSPDVDLSHLPAQRRSEIRELHQLLTGCKYGVVFFGLGLAQQPLGHLVVEALLRLVAELNTQTRFSARRMRIPGDVSGADNVLCWQTGFPFAVNLSRQAPRYNPGEFSANELLEREEVDACLIVGSESVDWLTPRAQRTLSHIPVIALDTPETSPQLPVAVQFTVAIPGLQAPGTVYRMDDVPIPIRRLTPSELPTDAEILNRINSQLE